MPVIYSVTTQSGEIQIGDQFEVVVQVEPQGQNINAFEGALVVDGAQFEPIQVRDADSIVSLWVERPTATNLVFSGVTPGGFQAETGKLFSVIFAAKQPGKVTIELVNAHALLNDGEGGEAQVQVQPLEMTIGESTGRLPAFVASPQDLERPEPFTAVVSRDPVVFDGMWFVVFSTQDKGSGIARYEFIEEHQPGSIFRFFAPQSWETAQSPHVLADQSRGRYIYIRAVDNSGNEQISIVPPSRPLIWYEMTVFYGILLSSILLIGGMGMLLWKIKAKKHQ